MHNLFETINTIEILFETPLPQVIENIYTWESCFMLSYFALTFFEIWAIKFWLKFIRKRMVVMNESFIVFSLTSINTMLSTLWSIAKVMLGDLIGSFPLYQSLIKAPSGRK